MNKKIFLITDTQNKYITFFKDGAGETILIGDTITYLNRDEQAIKVKVIGFSINAELSESNTVEVSRYLKVQNLETDRIYTINNLDNTRIVKI